MSQRIEYGKFTIAVVAVARLRPLEKNARFMTAEQLRRLVDNIKKDGQISQIPFCVPLGDDPETCDFRILSGNHRTEAAKLAGLTEIPIIYTTEALTKDEQLAIQLSHNAISGQDDPVILKELFDELDDVAAKLYSGLDDKVLRQLEQVQLPSIAEVRLDFRTLTFMFLPEEQAQLEACLDEARAAAERSDVYLARFASFDKLLDALETVQQSYNIKNAATALLTLFAVMAKHLPALEAGWFDDLTDTAKHKGWVPLATVFGTDKMPAEAAVVVRQALARLLKAGDITDEARWRGLELMAAEVVNLP